jgi:hypothetical protein
LIFLETSQDLKNTPRRNINRDSINHLPRKIRDSAQLSTSREQDWPHIVRVPMSGLRVAAQLTYMQEADWDTEFRRCEETEALDDVFGLT